MDQKKFFKDILSINRHTKNANPNMGTQISEFSNSIFKGLCEGLPEEDKKAIESIRSEQSIEECIDEVLKLPEADLVLFMDYFLDTISQAGNIQHQGVDINLSELKDQYKDMKKKLQKYEESEDINNF
jgi:hypothetical protein